MTIISWIATAVAGIAAGLAIPMIGKEIIDGPIAADDLTALDPLGLLALALGVVEAVIDLPAPLVAGHRGVRRSRPPSATTSTPISSGCR